MNKHRTHRTWWNRLLSGVLCLALALGLLPAAGLVQTAAAASWADPYGELLVKWGILQSAPDLRLDETVTRAEFVAMCNRAFGYSKLGNMPFMDVPSTAWYAQDINIAYNAGYLDGTTSDPSYPTASPNDPLTREQAVVLIARNLRLQETVGESLGFTDSHTLSEWSRGFVGAAVKEGMIEGYDDGSFQPFNRVTRGEVAVMLVRVLGTPINAQGSYEMGNVYGNLTISSSSVTLRNTIVLGNLYITGGVDLGNVLLENVTVLGRIVVSGGGESNAAKSSVILRNVVADEMVVDSLVNQFVTISAYGLTDIPNTYVRSNSYLDDSCAAGYGLHHIELVGGFGTRLQLAGSIKEVVNKTPGSTLQLVKGTAKTITIDEYAVNSELLIDINTVVEELNLDVATLVYGEGDIINLNIAADGCEVEILPEHVEIRPGISATIDGEKIGSAAASELSSEPRLMAGYPDVNNFILDTKENLFQANGMFSGNKPGTIYWAVSAIADGSVPEKDLINNPTYGGNIYEGNAGRISAGSKLVYVQPITKLEPDGSYYVSAILEDARGNRSPLKVISFTTPDNTQPDFVEAPHMTRTTCEVAQVTTMVNKNCQIYWVLLKAGAAAPTPQNFKSGSFAFGGNYGSGSQSVVKNVPVSITVNSTQLQQKTDYDLYLWLNDYDGTMCSEVVKVVNEKTGNAKDPSFTTPDETPPVVTSLEQTNFSLEDSIEFKFMVNEAPVTLYWAVVEETNTKFITASEDLNSLRVQMRVQNGAGSSSDVIVSGSKEANSANQDIRVTWQEFLGDSGNNLANKGTHNFKMYYVAVDADENRSEVKSIIIHTVDNEPPIVSIDFSSAMYNTDEDKAAGRKPRPQANSDIILIFSEQVKGGTGEDARTFVDLYSEVARYDGVKGAETLLANAKKALGEELAKHITMFFVQGRTETEMEAPSRKANGELEDQQETYGWIDWREATVKLISDGTVELTLPAGKAVQMGGGMTYYFHLEDIFDDSYSANRLAYMADNNGDGVPEIVDGGGRDFDVDMDSFTTVYAQVWLSEDEEGISESEVSAKVIGADGNYKSDKVKLDTVILVEPQSASQTADNDYWDMVIWNADADTTSASVTSITVEIYYSEDGKDWKQVTGAKRITKGDAMNLTANKVSAYYGTDGSPYETIADGLKQGKTYYYGVRVTEINGSADDTAWSANLTLRFSLVAGTRNNVMSLGNGIVSDNYTNLVHNQGRLSEIGSATVGNGASSTTQTILEVYPSFTDKRPPAFMAEYPTFTATSGAITMNAYLNRAGTLYYLAVPAANLSPYYTATSGDVWVTSDNDGRGVKNGEIPESGAYEAADVDKYFTDNKLTGLTYIPISGKDRETNAKHIYFKNDGTQSTPANYVAGKYRSPVAEEIYLGVYKNMANSVAGSYSYTMGGSQPVNINGNLLPGTWYYVYVVLRSESGTFDNVVQVYRVRTKDAEPPRINIYRTTASSEGSSTTGASITVLDRDSNERYDNPELFRTLWRKDKLPALFNQYYIWDENLATDTTTGHGPFTTKTAAAGSTLGKTANPNSIKTVLDAILDRYESSGLSWFDRFASDSLKNQVVNYITVAGSSGSVDDTTYYYTSINENYTLQECVKELKEGGEYVLLVCARHYSADEKVGANYGFSAIRGLYKPDPKAPELTYPIPGVLLEADIRKVTNSKNEDVTDDWGYGKTPVASLAFSGTLTIRFDKPIYTYDTSDSGALKQIVGTDDVGDDTAGRIAITSLISTAAFKEADVKTDDLFTEFTFEFEGLRNNQILSLSRLCNSTGVQGTKTLTITFKPTTRLNEVDQDSFLPIYTPCFEVSWK